MFLFHSSLHLQEACLFGDIHLCVSFNATLLVFLPCVFCREAVMPPESMLTITYDELVANTTTTVNRAFDFLGVARYDSCADPKTSPAIATGPGNVVLRRPVRVCSSSF